MEREEIRKILGEVISKKRRMVNVSQEELAGHLGVTKSSICRYENGKMEIPASLLPVISEYCDFPLRDYIVKLEAYREVNKVAEYYSFSAMPGNGVMVKEDLVEYLAEPKQQDTLDTLMRLNQLQEEPSLTAEQKETTDIMTLALFEMVTDDIRNELFKEQMKCYCDRIRQIMREK